MAYPLRTDWIYLIVKVLKTKNTYRLRKFRPDILEPNEICYAFKFNLDPKEWLERIQETEITISPPSLQNPEGEVSIEKSTSQKVVDRMAGR